MYPQNNTERHFDLTLKKALPYLILTPPEFRNKIADRMDSLFHFLQGGDSSITTFTECNNGILEMLKDAQMAFDSTTNRRIDALERIYKCFDERISDLDERLHALEKGRNKTGNVERPRKDPVEYNIESSVEEKHTPSLETAVSSEIENSLIGDKKLSSVMVDDEKKKRGRPKKDMVSNTEIMLPNLTRPVVDASVVDAPIVDASVVDAPIVDASVVDALLHPEKHANRRIYTSKLDEFFPEVIKYLQIHGEINRKQIMDLCEIGIPDAQGVLKRLIKKNIISMDGKRGSNKTRYILINQKA